MRTKYILSILTFCLTLGLSPKTDLAVKGPILRLGTPPGGGGRVATPSARPNRPPIPLPPREPAQAPPTSAGRFAPVTCAQTSSARVFLPALDRFVRTRSGDEKTVVHTSCSGGANCVSERRAK